MKLRIGILIPRLGITDRGAEVFVYELTKRLIHNFDITIWTRVPLESSSLISILQDQGVQIEHVKSASEDNWFLKLLGSLPFLKTLLVKLHLTPFEIEMLIFSLKVFRQIRKKKVDILFPANGFWGVLVCWVIRKIYSTPFVYASLGGIEPMIARLKPNKYICIHPATLDWLKTFFPKLPVMYIPSGVDLMKFNPNGKKARIKLPQPIFLSVSALIPSKRIDLTIKAVGKLKKGSLLIIGDGPLKNQLMSEAQKYLGRGHYLFRSSQYYNLDDYYRAAKVFVHSAPQEVGWSIVLLEALATNLPVVANKDDNIQKLLKNAGIACDVTDIQKFSDALHQALFYNVRGLPRKAALNFSWEKIAVKYKNLFARL